MKKEDTIIDKSGDGRVPAYTYLTLSVVEEFIEAGAVLEHERWGRWQEYVFSKCQQMPTGDLIIPRDLVTRWKRQIATLYSELSEQEKESDRKEVRRKYLPLILRICQEMKKQGKVENKNYPPPIKTEIWGGEGGLGNMEIELPDVFSIRYVQGYNNALAESGRRLDEFIKNNFLE